ncbi:unnamed protein product [Peniophora sp. CBMAI 1063]|nr:unnamed protein product [Peniophora sp. CBMAI 1063]
MDLRQLKQLLHDRPLPDLIGAITYESDRPTLLRLLDSELRRREERFRLIQEYRNLFGPPVHALPREVLEKIFFFYALDEEYKTLIELRWTRLLLVCRRWRDVACSTPLLWSFVSLEPFPVWPIGYDPELLVRRVALQRERVGRHPMRVWLDIADISLHDTFFRPYQPFYWIPSSLAHLSIKGRGRAFNDLFSSMMPHDYPLLTSLGIHHGQLDELLFIPDAFISRLATLRHLKISGAHVNFHLLHDLRTLQVDYSFRPIHCTIDDILVAVSHNPRLQSLAITLPSDASASANSLPAIHLSELLELALRGPSGPCVQILGQLKLSGGCVISFSASDEIDISALQPLLAYLRSHCALPDTPTIASLALQMDAGSSRAVDISFCATSTEPLCRRFLFGRWIFQPHHIHIVLPAEADGQCDELLTAIFAYVPVQHATLLDLRHLSYIGHAPLLTVLRGSPSLSVITGSLGLSSIDGVFLTLPSRLEHPQAGNVPARIILDASYLTQRARRAIPGVEAFNRQIADLELARSHLRNILDYCATACEAGKPVDVLELVNDCDVGDPDRRPSYVANFRRGDLWRSLRIGFVRNGVIRNKSVVLEELQEARRECLSHGEVWDPEETHPYLVDELDDPVALVGLAD